MSGSSEEALFALALEKPLEDQITVLDAICEGSPFQARSAEQNSGSSPAPRAKANAAFV